jgi:Domain of Unknown Function (DUF1259)
MQPSGVYKFALPRKDMKVVKDGVTVAPGLALGSWVAFKQMGSEAMVMGDLTQGLRTALDATTSQKPQTK